MRHDERYDACYYLVAFFAVRLNREESAYDGVGERVLRDCVQSHKQSMKLLLPLPLSLWNLLISQADDVM